MQPVWAYKYVKILIITNLGSVVKKKTKLSEHLFVKYEIAYLYFAIPCKTDDCCM